MNKALIVQAIIDALREEFESFQSSSKKARSGGSDSESKAESKYDTLSTEENYLADGLAKQALVAAQSAKLYENLSLAALNEDSAIDIGALVQMEFPDETDWFFLGPAGGGVEVTCEGIAITVITPESPLGAQLLGRKTGDKTTSPKARIRALQ
ncbi:MAG: transcription elongation factor GreAB [Chthoniobacterales bacterium]